MKTLLGIPAAMNSFARSQAQWQIDISRRIFSSRWRLALLIMLVIPALAFSAAVGADLLPDKVPVLGGSKALMPSFVTSHMFFGSILVGMLAGMITGVIGAGGGYVLTPALMSFGVRGIMAVGTDQFLLFANAIMGTTIHKKLGNVNFKLAVWFVVGSLTGVSVGGWLNRKIFNYSPALSDAVISSMYVVVLGILGTYSVMDWLRLRKSGHSAHDATTSFAHKLQAMPLRPRIKFDEEIVSGGRSIAVYPVIICGIIVGFVASIMGVGGGFLTFPMYVYGLGVSTFTTIGTDILQILCTTFYSSIFQYAIYGFVFYSVAIGMLLGSLIGVQIGANVTKVVPGAKIRVFYALTIMAGFVNRLCALPRKLGDLGYLSISVKTATLIEMIGTVVFFAIVGLFAAWIILTMAANMKTLRPDGTGLIRNPRKFGFGLAGLIIFFTLLGIGLSPVVSGKNVLQYVDNRFNELSKHSANYIEAGKKESADFDETSLNFGVEPRSFAESGKLTLLVTEAGGASTVETDGNGHERVRVEGKLGALGRAALEDSDAAFKNDWASLAERHKIAGEEVIYSWWVIFNGLTRRYVQENRSKEAEYSRFIAQKVLEPAYNFRNIEARSLKASALPIAGLLVFYVLYAVWYGFSMMWIFEGLGIAGGRHAKKET